MMVTNNTTKQINTALLGLRSSKKSTVLQEALETQQQEEENHDKEIIDNATSQYNAGYYLNDKLSKDTSSSPQFNWPDNPVVRQNYFIFGEFMCIWGTFTAALNTKSITVNSLSPERFTTQPVVVVANDEGQASTWNNTLGKVTYNNGEIAFTGERQFSWVLLGKVSQ